MNEFQLKALQEILEFIFDFCKSNNEALTILKDALNINDPSIEDIVVNQDIVLIRRNIGSSKKIEALSMLAVDKEKGFSYTIRYQISKSNGLDLVCTRHQSTLKAKKDNTHKVFTYTDTTSKIQRTIKGSITTIKGQEQVATTKRYDECGKEIYREIGRDSSQKIRKGIFALLNEHKYSCEQIHPIDEENVLILVKNNLQGGNHINTPNNCFHGQICSRSKDSLDIGTIKDTTPSNYIVEQYFIGEITLEELLKIIQKADEKRLEFAI